MDTLKRAWKKEAFAGSTVLSREKIQKYLQKRSTGMDRMYRAGLLTDMVLKGVISLALIVLVILCDGKMVCLVPALLLVIAVTGILYQYRTLRRIPDREDAEPVVRTSLERRISFFYRSFRPAIYVAALSGSLVFATGSLFYFHVKYGGIRPFTWDDYLVFSLAFLLAFILGAIANIRQYRFQVGQLEECLRDLDEEGLKALRIKDQRNQRMRNLLAILLALIAGILLFTYFLSRNWTP